MSYRIAQLPVDVVDVDRMSKFWSSVLGYRAVSDEDHSVRLVPESGSNQPTIWLHPVPAFKDRKNRFHPDLQADEASVEVARLLELGASHTDVGQVGDEAFVVLTDPEGNEFCVLDANQPAH